MSLIFLNSINDIWRGAPYPRKLHLLDNDFFGHDSWRNHIREIIDGDFRVCLSQGINVRMITAETAEALASIQLSLEAFLCRDSKQLLAASFTKARQFTPPTADSFPILEAYIAGSAKWK